MKGRLTALLLMILLLTVAAGCRREAGEKAGVHKLRVVATIFPVYDFARSIAGDKAEVRMLLPPGVEPHSFEPKPEDIVRVASADLFVYTDRYMEPWAGDLLRGAGSRNVLVVEAGQGVRFLPLSAGEKEGHGHGGMDPHIWLDLANAQIMVDNIAAGMAAKDPANRGFYLERAAAYKGQLAALDLKFRDGLAACGTRQFLSGGHYAFGYLAARYGLKYVAAYDVSADAEPTPKRIAALIGQIRSTGLKYIFYEELIAPTVADTIARETGARLLELNGIHNVAKDELDRGATFLSLMERNLANLKVGLQCR